MRVSSIFQWSYWRFRQPWPNHVQQFDYLDWETQRRLAYQQIDKGKFGYWTVVVASAGFLTDAYDIFAVNTVLPMLGLVYWNGSMPQSVSTVISMSLLAGTMFGQVVMGVLGDRYGRRRVYGIELLILTCATVLMSVASKGALASTNRVAWIATWRFVMGLGIGGDYPLSAVITAEFAPRKHRGAMLSTLFYMQAVGALSANVITVIITIILRDYIPSDNSTCDAECIESIDTMWRWIVGLGAIPPAIATLLRWCIPESPRYTMEVEKNPERANRDVQSYFPPLPSRPQVWPAGPSNRQGDNDIHPDSNIRRPSSGTLPTLKFGEAFEMADISLEEPALPINPPENPQITLRKDSWWEFCAEFKTYMFTKGNWTDLAGTSFSWMMLDFAFYCLSVNNPMILDKLWNSENAVVSVYGELLQNGYRALIAVSTGSIVGGALFIIMNRYRWALQYYGFCILAGVFVIVGVCFVTLVGTRYFAAVIVLFSLGSLFFYFGPNTSTYVIAAEVFPTKIRTSCHGFSAASGKFGSLIAQIFLAYARFGGAGINDPHSTWLGWVLFVFTIWMAVGAIITKFWVPNPVDIWGRSRTLEQMSLGKAERKRLERHEREIWRAFVPPESPSVGSARFAGQGDLLLSHQA